MDSSIPQQNWDIYKIIDVTASVLDLKINEDQREAVVRLLKTKIADEEIFALRFGGHYVKVCQKHITAKPQVKEMEDGKILWLCSTCGNEMVSLPYEKVEGRMTEYSDGQVDKTTSVEDLVSQIKDGTIKFESLSAGRKAHVSRMLAKENMTIKDVRKNLANEAEENPTDDTLPESLEESDMELPPESEVLGDV